MERMKLSENNNPDGKQTFLEVQYRKRRLADIKRGQAYFQKLDSLAERQWHKNTPHDSAGRRQAVAMRPLTDIKPGRRQILGKSDAMNKRIHSEQPRRTASENIANGGTDLPKSTSPAQKLTDIQNKLPHLRNGNTEHGLEAHGIFNKWGSSIHPLDEKVTLTDKDLTPMFEPFRFRDTVPHVLKPTPKHYQPMSRVSHNKDRQLKVQTNFLSRNGVVDIIPELEQWPDVESESRQKSFIPEQLQKEKTSVLMNRLDKIIDPFKQETNDLKLSTSEEDCRGSSPPSVSELSEIDNPSKSRDTGIVQKLPLYPKSITQQQKFRRKNLSFSKFLLELDRQPMGASRKCKIWVNNLERIIPKDKGLNS